MNEYKRNVGRFGLYYDSFPKGIAHLVSVERTFRHNELGRKFVELFLKIGRAACYNG